MDLYLLMAISLSLHLKPIECPHLYCDTVPSSGVWVSQKRWWGGDLPRLNQLLGLGVVLGSHSHGPFTTGALGSSLMLTSWSGGEGYGVPRASQVILIYNSFSPPYLFPESLSRNLGLICMSLLWSIHWSSSFYKLNLMCETMTPRPFRKGHATSKRSPCGIHCCWIYHPKDKNWGDLNAYPSVSSFSFLFSIHLLGGAFSRMKTKSTI